ncbi:hypothetical protein CHS0354_036140, partial [Potamilus streckersoni]
MEYTEKIGVTIVAESAELNGSSRLAADGFFHDDHCYIISDLIRVSKYCKDKTSSETDQVT